MKLLEKTLLIAAAALLGSASSHAATTYHWDGASAVQNNLSDNTTTTGQNWLSGGDWDNGATDGPLASWNSGDSAVFGGSAATQTVTLASGITAGDLTFGAGGDASGTTGTNYTITGSTITLGTSTITTNTDATIASILATGSLTKAGNGTLTLTGANTYSGATVNAGTLRIGDGTVNGTLGSGTYAIASGARLLLSYGASPTTPDWTKFSGAGTLELSDTAGTNVNYGALSLSGFTGTLTVSNHGRIQGGLSNLNGTTNVVLNNGAQFLVFDGTGANETFAQNFSISGLGTESGLTFGAIRTAVMNATFSGSIVLTGDSGLYMQDGQTGTATYSGVISDGGSGRALNLRNGSTGAGAALTLSGSNTFSGVATIQKGLVSVSAIGTSGNAGNLGKNATINLGSSDNSGATLRYTGTGETTDRTLNLANTTATVALDQSGTGLLKFTSAMTATGTGSKTFTLQGSTAGTGEIAGAITDNSGTNKTALTKAGTGIWTLSGTNTYTGVTTVSAGTLAVGATGQILATTTGGITIASGAALTLNGTLKLTSNLATLANAGSLTLGGTLDIGSYFNGQANGSSYQVVTGTAATGTFGNILWDHAAFSNVTYSGGFLNFTAVPEPATYGMIGAGALAVMAGVRRRRRIRVA